MQAVAPLAPTTTRYQVVIALTPSKKSSLKRKRIHEVIEVWTYYYHFCLYLNKRYNKVRSTSCKPAPLFLALLEIPWGWVPAGNLQSSLPKEGQNITPSTPLHIKGGNTNYASTVNRTRGPSIVEEFEALWQRWILPLNHRCFCLALEFVL